MPRNIDEKTISKTIGGMSTEVKVGSDQSIEIPTQDLQKEIEVESFMNEIVTVEVAETTNENEPPTFVLSVNGIHQPVMRGQPIRMRRMFVEVLARCKETKYNQRQANPNQPDRIELAPRTALAYPFQVIEDPNPKGRAWLRAVLMEAG